MYYCRLYVRLFSEIYLMVDILCESVMEIDKIIDLGIGQVLENMGKDISPALRAKVKNKNNWV